MSLCFPDIFDTAFSFRSCIFQGHLGKEESIVFSEHSGLKKALCCRLALMGQHQMSENQCFNSCDAISFLGTQDISTLATFGKLCHGL